jgi:hypothetical protein
VCGKCKSKRFDALPKTGNYTLIYQPSKKAYFCILENDYFPNPKYKFITMKLTFLHRPKPRQFSYKPVFYNPDEENKPKRDPSGEVSLSQQDRLRKEMAEKWRLNRKRNKSANMTLLLYILIIIGMLYLIFIAW